MHVQACTQILRQERVGDQVLGGTLVPLLAGLHEQGIPVFQRRIVATQPQKRDHLLLLVRLQIINDRRELVEDLVIGMIGKRLQRPVVARTVGLLGNNDFFFGLECPA
ncbi:hypothetical protein D3C81_2033430 [compost metagenome]